MEPHLLPLVGQVIFFAGDFAPEGWLFCDGKSLSINQYPALYSILYETYGGDMKNNTFRLPDLRDLEPKLKKNGLSGPRYIICVNGFYPRRTD